MKIVLFSGFPLDSSYNYTVNTNDWDTLVAQYYGMTREVLYDKISTSIEFNFIDRDSVHGSCTIDIATVTKIVKPNKTAKISTDYNYAIVYDNINNEYKHYFITGWDFVSSKKIGESFNNVYNVSFSLNLLAYFKVCETNNELPKNILVDRTHIWDNVSKYSNEGQNIEPQYKEEYITPIIKDNLESDKYTENRQILHGKWYYVITSKPWGDYKASVSFYDTSNFYCYCFHNDGYTNLSAYGYKTYNKPEDGRELKYISHFTYLISLLESNKISGEDIIKIYVSSLPPISYLRKKEQVNGRYVIYTNNDQGLVAGVSTTNIQLAENDYATPLVLGTYNKTKCIILEYDKIVQSKKTQFFPFTKLSLFSNSNIELQPNVTLRLYTALSPTKLSFVVVYDINYIEGNSSYCTLLDCSNELPIATSAWNNYIANNKNYYQMGVDIPRERANNATAGAILNMGGGLLGGLGRIAMGDVAGGVGGALDRAVSQMGNIAVSQMNAGTTIKENQLQWDNIQNAPNKVMSLGTNIGQFSASDDVKIVISRLNDTEIKTLETIFYRSGYKYGANVDTYAKLFVCTNFNYVKLGEPLFARYYGENLTDIQRDLLSEILSRGITYFEPSWFVTHGLDYPETNPYKETV